MIPPQMNKVSINLDPINALKASEQEGTKGKKLCPIPIQKETPSGFIDTVCNGDLADKNTSLCRFVLLRLLLAICFPPINR